MFSSILSTSYLWILWVVLGVILFVVVFIVTCKICDKQNEKKQAKNDKAWAENVKRNQAFQEQRRKQDDDKKKAYKEQLDKKLEIKCVTDKNGGDDLAELLILIIRHNSLLNYRESIDVSGAILDIYDNIEKAKVKAANYINGISKSDDSVSIYDIDAMSGVEFEEFVGKLFEKLGYTTEITKASADQGVDLIAKKDGKLLAIQAKCYSGVVGNHAIMEVVAGMKYYDCNCCMVVTNSAFTPAAKELAKANNVELWDRNELKEQMELLGM